MSSNYVDYYHRVKEFGKMQKWDLKKVNAMLGDKMAFEREYKLVSCLFFYIYPNFCYSRCCRYRVLISNYF